MTDPQQAQLEWRTWNDDDPAAERCPKIAALAGADHPALLLYRDQAVVGAIGVSPNGAPAHPSHRRIEIEWLGDPAAIPSSAFTQLRNLAACSLVACWDAMDAQGIRSLENAGFKPGAQPYFELGGGAVEYVMGYSDPTGSILELILD